MKLQVTQENLNRALSNVARVAISARNPLPIVSNVLLRTVDNRLLVSATNLEIAISERIGAKIIDDGAITVPARLMQEFVAALPSGVIDIQLNDHKLKLTSADYESVINGVSADEFPVVPEISSKASWVISGLVMKKSIQQVLFTASSDESRPVLTSIFLHSHNGELYMVATDSYRLAEKKMMNAQEDISLLIPASALQDLLRIIGDGQHDVEFFADTNQVQFRVGETEIVSRLIDGNYPDYRKLIPSSHAVSFTLSRDEFVTITKVASLFARESAGSITLKADSISKTVSITSIASQVGENISKATAEVEGDGEVTLNSKYLLDALGAFTTKKVTFSFNGKLDPCVLTSSEAPDYLHIVMPLKG